MALFYGLDRHAEDTIECPVQRARQAAIERFIQVNGDIPYVVEERKKGPYWTFVVKPSRSAK